MPVGKSRTIGVFAALLIAAPLPARADDWFGEVTCGQSGQPACDLEVGTGATGNQPNRPVQVPGEKPQGQSAGQPEACEPVIPQGLADPADQQAWRDFICGGTNVATGSLNAPGIVFSPAEVAAAARRRLALPFPAISTSPLRDQLVNLPTWMWLEGGWRTVTATASVPGVSVTATATPTSVTWSMGDGTNVTCTGAGTPYTETTEPEAASPDCGHVYRRSSASQPGTAFKVTATVHWTVAWAGAGAAGTFPEMATTSTVRLRVAESHGLNTTRG